MNRNISAETIVVGAGSSGCAVAGRLAEANRDVMLLEAGPDYGAMDSGQWPAELLDARMLATTHDWGYGSGRWEFQRARVIGGCSSHNGAIAAVGHRLDYDAWNLPGWSGNDVEAIYRDVLERMRVRTYRRDEAAPFHAQCLQAAEALNWNMAEDLCDLDANDSFGLESVNIDGTTRWNAAFAYLDPVRGRSNLRIMPETEVDRFETFSGGVRVFAIRGKEPVELVCKQLVLSGGAYGTPCVLQRSGVGDAKTLTALGIDVVADNSEVGANLHDHPMACADREVGPELQSWLDEAAAKGFLPEEQTLGKAISSYSEDGLYDLHVFPVCASNQTSILHGRVAVQVAVMTPRSRGRIDIVSRDPTVHPRIDHAYLSDAEEHDIRVMADGLKMAEALLDQPQLSSLLGNRVTETSSFAAIRAQVAHYYHPVGSCRMGTDPEAVCDADGRVNGVEGVIVADASLMPMITRANTNLPAVMIGERIAQTL